MRTIEGYEVIVVGGGPGGVGAAVAAGRSGAKTLLIEREGCLGGGATTMLVHPFMPHTTRPGSGGEPRKVVNAGLFKEMTDRLVARGAGKETHRVEFDDECMKLVLDELVSEAGVNVMFHAALFDAEVEDGRVAAIRVAHNGGPLRITGKVFIDATGDALLSSAAGAEVLFGDESGTVMPMTLNFIVAGVNTDEIPSGREMKQLAGRGDKDTPALINTHFSTWSVPRPGTVHFNAIRISGNTLDPFDLSKAEIEGRRRVENYVTWLRAKLPAFSNCYLLKTGSHIGVRESRRVAGDYMLTVEDFDRAAKFEDGIACCSYGIDRHEHKPNETLLRALPPGEYYHIPYRSLIPKGLQNLLVASRSISADVLAHSSLRIMPVVMNIGEAAGYAGAMSLPSGDVRAVDIEGLREKIRDGGGVLEADVRAPSAR